MTIQESVLEKLQSLPAEKQRQVLDYVQSLLQPGSESPTSRRTPEGLWARLAIDISADEIDENGRRCSPISRETIFDERRRWGYTCDPLVSCRQLAVICGSADHTERGV